MFSDGSVCIATPFDPLFFALPLLDKCSRFFSPLHTILADGLDALLTRNLHSILTTDMLSKICDVNSTCARVSAVYLSFGPIKQSFTVSVTEARARRPCAAASVSRRRRERRTLLAGGGMRARRSHTLMTSQAFACMRFLLLGENLETQRYLYPSVAWCVKLCACLDCSDRWRW